MKGMEKISSAILDKVRAEAESIVKDAGEKAREEREKAKKQQEAKLLEGKNKMIEEARSEAAQIRSQGSMSVRRESLTAKNEVINKIISEAKKSLANFSGSETSSLGLIKEGINILGVDKARIYVSPKDVSRVQKIVKGDKELADKITEVKENKCLGGVVVESIDGKLRIDNTYETRLEMLLPKLLPEINKELF